MTVLLFGVLKEGLILWNTKESNKYLDQVIDLEKEWTDLYFNVSRSKRNNKRLDEIERELGIISKAFMQHRSQK